MTTGVYKFTCRRTGHFYIGSAVDIARRRYDHLRKLRKGKHHNQYFQRVFTKYGEMEFKFETIRTDTVEEARSVEQHFLDKHHGRRLCMNIGRNATGGDNLTGHPERESIIANRTETLRARISRMSFSETAALYGKPAASNPMYGRTHTEEVRKRLSEAMKGNKYALGAIRSKEVRARLSEVAKTRTGERNGFYGKTHSEDTRKVLSITASARAASGILPSNTMMVRIGRKKYRSASAAARVIGCTPATVLNRVRSAKFPEYEFVNA